MMLKVYLHMDRKRGSWLIGQGNPNKAINDAIKILKAQNIHIVVNEGWKEM